MAKRERTLPNQVVDIADAVTQGDFGLGRPNSSRSLPACRRQGEATPAGLAQQLSWVQQGVESYLEHARPCSLRVSGPFDHPEQLLCIDQVPPAPKRTIDLPCFG